MRHYWLLFCMLTLSFFTHVSAKRRFGMHVPGADVARCVYQAFDNYGSTGAEPKLWGSTWGAKGWDAVKDKLNRKLKKKDNPLRATLQQQYDAVLMIQKHPEKTQKFMQEIVSEGGSEKWNSIGDRLISECDESIGGSVGRIMRPASLYKSTFKSIVKDFVKYTALLGIILIVVDWCTNKEHSVIVRALNDGKEYAHKLLGDIKKLFSSKKRSETIWGDVSAEEMASIIAAVEKARHKNNG